MTWTLPTLQADALAWQNYNFPHTTPAELLLGISEELGELGHALLTGNIEHTRDSLADMGIFATNFANKIGLDIDASLRAVPADTLPHVGGISSAFFQLAQYCGELSHAMLKIKQGIRGQNEQKLYEAFSRLWHQFERSAPVFGVQFYDALYATWDIVRQRDWRKYPETGIAYTQ